MPTGTTGHIQHPPARSMARRVQDERHSALGLSVVPMRVELEILLTKPLLEPFHGGSAPEANT